MIANSNGGSELLCDFDDLVELFIEWIAHCLKQVEQQVCVHVLFHPLQIVRLFRFLNTTFDDNSGLSTCIDWDYLII